MLFQKNYTYKTLLLAIAFCLMQAAGILPLQADNAAWMGSIPDNTFVSQLSIPGSHDAGTGHGVNNVYVVVSGNTYAKTQDKTLTEQWNSGVLDEYAAVAPDRAFGVRNIH